MTADIILVNNARSVPAPSRRFSDYLDWALLMVLPLTALAAALSLLGGTVS